MDSPSRLGIYLVFSLLLLATSSIMTILCLLFYKMMRNKRFLNMNWRTATLISFISTTGRSRTRLPVRLCSYVYDIATVRSFTSWFFVGKQYEQLIISSKRVASRGSIISLSIYSISSKLIIHNMESRGSWRCSLH